MDNKLFARLVTSMEQMNVMQEEMLESEREISPPVEPLDLKASLGLWGDQVVDGLEYESELRDEWAQ